MMFVLGVMGVLQCTAFPGAIFIKLMRVRLSGLQRVVYTFALSLLLNYCVVLVLVFLRLYLQPVVLSMAMLEVLSLVWLYRQELQTPLLQAINQIWNHFSESIQSFIPTSESGDNANQSFSQLLPVVMLGLAIYSLVNIWIVLKLFIYNLGTIFNAWDVIVSWNRWAVTWASNSFPLDSHFYPQMIPVTWSTIYVAMGTTEIHFFAKAIMPLFPLFLLVLLFDLGARFKQIGFFITLILSQLLLKKFLGQEFNNGYVDVAIAFFSFLPLHALLLARNTLEKEQRYCMLFFGALFAVAASLTKQSGLYIFAFYPVFVFIALFKPVNLWATSISWKKSLVYYSGLALLPVGWYLFRLILFWLGKDRAETSGLIQISSSAYDHVGLFPQMVLAFANFDKYIFLFLVVLIAIPLLDPLYRAIAVLFVFPYPLLWAWGASYDTRNLAPFLPVFVLISGLSLQTILEFLIRMADRLGLRKVKNYWIAAVLLLVLIIGGTVFSTGAMQKAQTQQELQSFSPEINQRIYAIIKKDGPQTKFLTNYPIRYLPNLENNQIQFSFRDFSRFQQLAADPGLKYMLIPGNQLDSQIEDVVNRKIADGIYKVLLIDKSWVKFTLLEVVQK